MDMVDLKRKFANIEAEMAKIKLHEALVYINAGHGQIEHCFGKKTLEAMQCAIESGGDAKFVDMAICAILETRYFEYPDFVTCGILRTGIYRESIAKYFIKIIDGTSGMYYEVDIKPGIGADESQELTHVLLNRGTKMILEGAGFGHDPLSNKGQFFIKMKADNLYRYGMLLDRQYK
jgi:hypothetical protein